MTPRWFSLSRREPARLELYGKLPLAKDYLRVGCAEGSALALREWADAAFSGEVDGDAPRLAWPARFVLGWAARDPVIGCVWPSSDTGGLRPFPFFLALARSEKSWRASFESGAVVRDGTWRALDQARARLCTSDSAAELLSAARGVRIEELEPAPTPASPALDAWCAAVGAGRAANALRTYAAEIASRARALGIARVPIAHGSNAIEQACAWWLLLRGQGSSAAPWVLFPGDDTAADEPLFAVFWTRPPAPADAVWLGSARDGQLGASDASAPEPVHLAGAPGEPPLCAALVRA